ncbi:MAG: hypothetical protein V1773_14760 [bacterium]
MNLIPIVYSSLLICVGLLAVVLIVSFIASKLKKEDQGKVKINHHHPKEIKPLYAYANQTQIASKNIGEIKRPIVTNQSAIKKTAKYRVISSSEEKGTNYSPKSYEKNNYYYTTNEKRHSTANSNSQGRYKRISTTYENSVDYGFNRNSLSISNLSNFSDNQLLNFYSDKF